MALNWNGERARNATRGELLGGRARAFTYCSTRVSSCIPSAQPWCYVRPTAPPRAFDLRSSDVGARQAFLRYARYPFGIDSELLDRFLEAIGEDSVTVRRRR